MAYSKKIWKARQGLGLNKFSIDGATPVPVVNQPDSVTQQGDALSAGNLNDLETRIANAFDDVEESKADKTEVETQISVLNKRIDNLEQTSGQTELTVSYPDDVLYSPNLVPAKSAKWAGIKTLRGKTRAWNQLHSSADATYTLGGLTVTRSSNGYFTISSGTAGSNDQQLLTTINVQIGHKYIVGDCFAQRRNGSTWKANLNDTSTMNYAIVDTTGWDSGDTINTYVFITNGQSYNVSRKYYPICRDLTLIFPEGVPSTIAECVAKCPDILKYDAYNVASLVTETVSAVKSVGVNIFDEEWEQGEIDGTTGQNTSNSNSYRSKNYIPVLPETEYYFYNSLSNKPLRMRYYDANKNYLGQADYNYNTDANNSARKMPTSCLFIRFCRLENTISVVQVCLNSYADKTTYHAHEEHTLTLPSNFTGKSAGSVAEVYDLETGKVSHPIGSYTFDGTETWTYRNTDGAIDRYRCNEILTSPSTDSNRNVLVDNNWQGGNGYSGTDPYLLLVANDSLFLTIPTGQNPSDYFTNGKTLHYELATPDPDTDLAIIDDPTIQVQGGGTIETVQTQSPVLDNSLEVTYDIIP